jgi:hypothetical protein
MLPDPLPLFPLKTVLFPGALLELKVFETRYLDLMSECMRQGTPFGVVCLRQGQEASRSRASEPPTELEDVGVLVRIDDIDAEQAGILKRNNFESGKAVYELDEGEHHDHLVCLQCGRVEEFHDPEIERRQHRIAKDRGFALQDHSLALYANCIKSDCPDRG